MGLIVRRKFRFVLFCRISALQITLLPGLLENLVNSLVLDSSLGFLLHLKQKKAALSCWDPSGGKQSHAVVNQTTEKSAFAA